MLNKNCCIILPIRFPHLFTDQYSRFLTQRILLYGAPRSGKSYLVRAVANEARNNSKFFSICFLDLLTNFAPESESLIKNLFKNAIEQKPSIIFIEQIETLLTFENGVNSEYAHRAKTEFLIQMDSLHRNNERVIVLAATNFPWHLDIATKKRFDTSIHFSLPNAEERQQFLKLHLDKTNHSIRPEDFLELSYKTEGFTGTDIGIVVQNAQQLSNESILNDNLDNSCSLILKKELASNSLDLNKSSNSIITMVY